MPIVDLAPMPLSTPVDTPKRFAVTPGQDDIDHGSEKPDGSVLGAAFRQGNTLGSYFADQTRGSPDFKEDGYNPWESIKGTKYEPNFKAFGDIRNTIADANMKRQIDQEENDRKILEAAPFIQSFPAQLAAGIIDLPTLLPGGAFVRGAKGGFALGRSAAVVGGAAGMSTAAQELALHATQETRPLSESAINIGASVLLGGLLGAGGAKLLSKAEWNSSVAAIDRQLAGDVTLPARDGIPVENAGLSSVGAASAMEPVTLADVTIAGRMAGAVAAASRPLNPILRLLQSPSLQARLTFLQGFENPVYLKMNMEGRTVGDAAETLAKGWNAGLGTAVKATDEAFGEHIKAGGNMTSREFREAVGRAMRRGDEDAENPFVSKVAKEWRAKVFDPLKQAAIEAKLLPEDVSVETAASYFSRMWNRNKLIAREGEFKGIVQRWVDGQAPKWATDFDRETAEKAAKLKDEKLRDYLTERRIERADRFDNPQQAGIDIGNEVFDTLTGRAGQGVRPEFVTVKARGPLKERTFNIPDHLVEDFLESDVDLVGRRYARVMGADVEIARKFGSVDMVDQIQKIRDDYAKLRSGMEDDQARRMFSLRKGFTAEEKLSAIAAAEKSDIGDIEALRDLLRGTKQESPIERGYSRIVRAANHLNYIRSMGEVVLASITDAVRPAMVHGLGQFMQTTGQIAGNMKAVKLSVGEAQLAGNVLERVLGHRLATITDIIDPYASRGPIEAMLENMTNFGSKWNGIRMWTDMMKSFASVMTQNRILAGVENFANIKPSEKAYLAYLGIDQGMAERIAAHFKNHGETLDGVKVANTEKWVTPDAPGSKVTAVRDGKEVVLSEAAGVKGGLDSEAIRAYRAAMNKDVDSIIVQKGVADVPLFASTPTGKMLLQFKSFALASHQRVLLRGLQEDQARFLGGTIAMTAVGMMITYLKAVSGNRPETREKALKNPGWWIGEGFDRSGIVSAPMELANTFEKATGFNPVKSPLKAMDDASQMSQKNQNRSDVGSLLGPTVGMAGDVMAATPAIKNLVQGDEVTKGQKGAAERLLPFNSYMGLRQILRYVVNVPD
jgi:hypothetical protein